MKRRGFLKSLFAGAGFALVPWKSKPDEIRPGGIAEYKATAESTEKFRSTGKVFYDHDEPHSPTVTFALFDENGDEISAPDYRRITLPNNHDTWNPSEFGIKTNKAEVAFPRASTDWGLVGSLCVSVGGPFAFQTKLAIPRIIRSSDQAFFQPGSIRLTLE